MPPGWEGRDLHGSHRVCEGHSADPHAPNTGRRSVHVMYSVCIYIYVTAVCQVSHTHTHTPEAVMWCVISVMRVVERLRQS